MDTIMYEIYTASLAIVFVNLRFKSIWPLAFKKIS